MSQRANPTVVGAFVLGAIAIAVAGALILSGRAWFGGATTYVMFFDGSVAGLSVGAPVELRGVQLGTVSDIRLASPYVAVFASIDVHARRLVGRGSGRVSEAEIRGAVERAIERGLRAQLQTQSLITGQLTVALDYFPDTEARFIGIEHDVPEIPTVHSTVQEVSEQIRQIIARLEKLPLEQLLTSGVGAADALKAVAESPQLKQTVQGAAATLRDTRAMVRRLDAQVDPLAGSARRTLEEMRTTVAALRLDVGRALGNLEREVGPLAQNANQTLDGVLALTFDARKLVRQTGDQLGPLATSLTSTSDMARATLERAQATLDSADSFISADSPLQYELAQALEQVAEAARSLRTLADGLERQPSSLLFGRRPPACR
jgi:paraquat-inducible protein B